MAKSGHTAGAEFAARCGLTTVAEVEAYAGNSTSFKEGMMQYVEALIAKEKSQTATSSNQANQ